MLLSSTHAIEVEIGTEEGLTILDLGVEVFIAFIVDEWEERVDADLWVDDMTERVLGEDLYIDDTTE